METLQLFDFFASMSSTYERHRAIEIFRSRRAVLKDKRRDNDDLRVNF